VVARALGFAGLDLNVASVQGGRGKLEAAVLFWCTQLGHDVARLSQDVILFSGEEFGYLVLPPELATGSSIMPHKQNPDLFELTRGRAAAVEGDLLSVLQIKAKLSGGYHRDFQLLKEPLMRGLERTRAMLQAITHAVPRLKVDPKRCAAALAGNALATDEVMRRVEAGRPFRSA
jgi:argininosuccinate lyase